MMLLSSTGTWAVYYHNQQIYKRDVYAIIYGIPADNQAPNNKFALFGDVTGNYSVSVGRVKLYNESLDAATLINEMAYPSSILSS